MMYSYRATILSYIVTLTCLIVAGTPAFAGAGLTVGDLAKRCGIYLGLPPSLATSKLSRRQLRDVATCTAYIAGFHHGKTAANVMNKTTGPYCVGQSVTTRSLAKVFVLWARKHRRASAKPAGFGIIEAMVAVAGCGP